MADRSPTDSTSLDPVDERLAAAFARYASSVSDSRSTALIADMAIRGATRSRGPNSLRWRSAVFALAAALVLPIAWLASGSSPAPPPQRPDADPGTYQAVVLRGTPEVPGGVEVVLARSDGTQRTLRRIGPKDVAPGTILTGDGTASPEGWLALSATVDHVTSRVLFDLGDPDRPARVIPVLPDPAGSWGPGGRYAAVCPDDVWSDAGRRQGPAYEPLSSGALPGANAWPCWNRSQERLQIVDATTGQVTVLDRLVLPGGGPDIVWPADGSGIVVRDDRLDTTLDPNGLWIEGAGDLLVARLDGGVGDVARGMYPRPGRRWIGTDGRRIPWSADGIVVEGYGSSTAWRVKRPGEYIAASFTADGAGILAVISPDDHPDRAQVIGLDAPGLERVVADVQLPEPARALEMSWLAPDDSVIALLAWYGDGADVVLLVPMGGGGVTRLDGWVAGFVPSTLADGWQGVTGFASAVEPVWPTVVPTSEPAAD